MIQIIAGKKGSGKTKRLIDMTNETAAAAAGSVIFIDDDNRYMFDIDRSVRFVNAADYHVVNGDMFIGFVSGMLSQNFDISTIFIDAFLKMVKVDAADAKWIFAEIASLSEKHNVKFVISLSTDIETLPEYLKPYLI